MKRNEKQCSAQHRAQMNYCGKGEDRGAKLRQKGTIKLNPLGRYEKNL